MKVMAAAMKNVKGEITGEKLKAALENLKNFDTGGLTAVPISFSKTSHKGSMGLRIYQIQKGKFVPIKKVVLSR
jgi:branched-chain amino acid transport system substrate-binding protein